MNDFHTSESNTAASGRAMTNSGPCSSATVGQMKSLFIWPTPALAYIDKVALGLTHAKRLEHVLFSAEPKPWIASPLDNLYRAILQAHAPENAEELLRFNQWLAYFCLPVGIAKFVSTPFRGLPLVDYTNIALRVIFDGMLDELCDSVTDLSSLFLPRKALSEDESVTPAISRLSPRDFIFNRTRCGEKFYYFSTAHGSCMQVSRAFQFSTAIPGE